jgi:hypothetical protein
MVPGCRFPIGASPMPVEIKVEGTKAISTALVEMFSPVTNLLGTVGDRVRVYRELSLLRSLKRARAIAAEEGLSLKEPPLKFLVPYLEDCSLELPEHNLFIRMLREMTVSEARLLECVVSKKTHPHYSGSWSLEDAASAWYDPYVYIGLQQAIAKLPEGLCENADFGSLEKTFREETEQPGAVIHYFSVAQGERGVYPLDSLHDNERGPIHDDFERTSIAILMGLGLLRNYASPDFWFGNFVIQVHAYHVTELGALFVKACTSLPSHGERE